MRLTLALIWLEAALRLRVARSMSGSDNINHHMGHRELVAVGSVPRVFENNSRLLPLRQPAPWVPQAGAPAACFRTGTPNDFAVRPAPDSVTGFWNNEKDVGQCDPA